MSHKGGKWRARIEYKGKSIYLGGFEKIEDAERARKAAEEKYYKTLLEAIENKETM